MREYLMASQKVIADPCSNGGSASNMMKSNVVGNGSRSQRRRRPVVFMGRKMKTKQKHNSSSPQSKDTTTSLLLSNKYRPRMFQDIVGQNIVVKTLCYAAEKKMIAPLYLFHGTNGTGKTSTARVFAMALNCESNNKPCCSCEGCSRSLYTMDLCSGNRISGFEKIKTLLQNTSFTQAIPGFKVFIIEECHLLTLEAWDELMSLLEGPYGSNLVFILITHIVDVNSSITCNITSRCQKYYFTKLNDEDVITKLSRIIVSQSMVIEEEALKLIVAKSDGSLRDAENILDQLTLSGPTIKTSMAQQLVGLIPHNKLLDLLAAAVSGDTINTIRYVKKLSECIEPSSFVSQLVNLVTNLLSEDPSSSSSSSSSANRTLLSKTQSARLCYILKLLVETERQLRSTSTHDQTSNIIATTFLDITSMKASNINNIVLPARSLLSTSSHNGITLHSAAESIIDQQQRRDAKRGSLSDMEQLWKDVLKGIESSRIQKFLSDNSKLALLSLSKTNAIIHLTFTRPEDKMAAEISEESLAKALEFAIGCSITLHMSLGQPLTMGQTEDNAKTTIHPLYSKQQNTNTNTRGESSRLAKSKSCSTSQRPHRYLSKGTDLDVTRMFKQPNSDKMVPITTNIIQAERDSTQSMRIRNPRHRWLSLSSIPQSDASVEPYSQDVIYENTNKDGDDTHRKFNKSFSKNSKDHRVQDQLQSNPAWCC